MINKTVNQAITGLPDTFANYRARFNPGNKIVPADVANLVTIYNAFRSHVHRTTDDYYLAYGNAYPFPTLQNVNDTTTTMLPLPAPIVLQAAPIGNKILVSVVNYYIARITGIVATHSHRIVDNWN